MLGIDRIFEYDDIPGLRFGEEIEIFEDEDTVAVADACFIIGVKACATERANRVITMVNRLRAVWLRTDRLRSGWYAAFAVAIAQIERVAAGGTGESEMGAAEGVGHAAGGDDEGFDGKGAEDKGQDEGDNEGFEGFLEGSHSAVGL